MKMDQMVLGEVYRDKMTGFEGVCTGMSWFWYGRDTVMLENADDSDEPVRFWIAVERAVRKEN